jgi:pyrrolidone-carboxylate peptidase
MIDNLQSILIYAFGNQWGTNISRLTLLELQDKIKNSNIKFQLIRSYPQEFFQKYIQGNQYDLIIGLGDCPSNKIKIETQAKNSYNDKPIYPFSPILIDLNIPLLENYNSNYFAISSNMGTYNCNWMAYSTQLYLDQKKLNTLHLFLHLPKKSNASFLASQIKILCDLNNII